MKTMWMLVLVALSLSACNPNDQGVLCLGESCATGSGGEGGSGGATEFLGCEPKAFGESFACYRADASCCDLGLQDMNKVCAEATDGAWPIAALCAEDPVVGTPTGLKCAPLGSVQYECAWGTSVLLCCQVQ